MPKTKEQKKEILTDLKNKIAKQKATVFVDYTGLKMKAIDKLRKLTKQENCEFKVAKKTLIEIAIKDVNQEEAATARKFTGELALVIGYEDELSPFRISNNFAKTNQELKILGGLFEKRIISQKEALRLAELPSREELLTKLVWTIKSPVSDFVHVLRGNVSSIVSVLTAIKETK